MRYDKYDPVSGGFRAALADDMAKTPGGVGDADAAVGVGLDVDGNVVPGGGQTGVLGLVCLTRDMVAGDIVDVMTDGEVVHFDGAAGTVYFAADADGVISTTNTGTRLGHTVEGDRLVVRVRPTVEV